LTGGFQYRGPGIYLWGIWRKIKRISERGSTVKKLRQEKKGPTSRGKGRRMSKDIPSRQEGYYSTERGGIVEEKEPAALGGGDLEKNLGGRVELPPAKEIIRWRGLQNDKEGGGSLGWR